MLIKNKKGIVEIQFNWLYVVIVGFVIIIAFISVINGIRNSSEKEREYEISKYFDTLLLGDTLLENSERNVSLYGMNLKIDNAKTGEAQCNYYSLGKTGIKQEIKYIPVFSLENIKSFLLSKTYAWDYPFRASFFIYITSPHNVFIYDDQTIKNYLPSNSKSLDINNNFINRNYDYIRYILVNENMPILDNRVSKLKDSQVSAVKIDLNKGIIEYYEKKGSNFVFRAKSFFFDKETLLAAIYSDNKNSYECNLKKAILRLNKITKTLIERSKILIDADILQSCDKNDYNIAKELLEKYNAITNDGEIEQNEFNDFKDIKDKLKNLNNELYKLNCPTIY